MAVPASRSCTLPRAHTVPDVTCSEHLSIPSGQRRLMGSPSSCTITYVSAGPANELRWETVSMSKKSGLDASDSTSTLNPVYHTGLSGARTEDEEEDYGRRGPGRGPGRGTSLPRHSGSESYGGYEFHDSRRATDYLQWRNKIASAVDTREKAPRAYTGNLDDGNSYSDWICVFSKIT
jgi:hypothetical protein